MISLYKQDGEVIYGIKEFFLDSEDDVKDLPVTIRSGSIAIIIPTGEKYILNGLKEWVLFGGRNISDNNLLNYLDQDSDGIIDESEEAHAVIMHDM